MELRLSQLPSPLGTLLLVGDGTALRALDFADRAPRLHRLLRLHYRSYTLTPVAGAGEAAEALGAYFAGALDALQRITVRTGGSVFQRLVWAELARVPAATTVSYGHLAARIGRPTASRAVGLANGANPVAIVVPCHRVIGADSTLTGYGGGLQRKAWLIAHERRYAVPAGPSGVPHPPMVPIEPHSLGT